MTRSSRYCCHRSFSVLDDLIGDLPDREREAQVGLPALAVVRLGNMVNTTLVFQRFCPTNGLFVLVYADPPGAPDCTSVRLAGSVDVIVVAKLDRFSRSMLHLVNAMAELQDLASLGLTDGQPHTVPVLRRRP